MPEALDATLRATTPVPLDVTLHCAPGEMLALVGPSGAGKSTVLRCIAGLHRAAEGEVRCGVRWFGSGVDVPPHRRAVGLVFQDYALFPHMTALANVMAAMGHRAPATRAAAARDWLARVHLAGLEERRPAELSGGQQQRVAMARALAREPAVLLLDEPFSAVDRATRRRLQAELAQLRRSLSVPIVMVTHDLDEALALADRMLLIHRGRALQTAPPAEMLARPANAEVARLLDLRNIYQAEVLGHAGEQTRLRWGELVLEAPRAAAEGVVDLLVAPSAVLLHRRDRPSAGERENPVPSRVLEVLALGADARVTLDVADPAGGPLVFTLPMHAARRNGLAPGEACVVSLLRDGLHIMPRG